MKFKVLPVLFIIVLTCSASQAATRFGLGVTGGYSPAEEVQFFRGAVKIAPGWTWFDQHDWRLGLHFDLGFIFMNSDSDVVNVTGAADDLQAISITPVWRIQRVPYANTIAPFIEGAVGASLFSEDTLQNDQPIGLQLGGTFQFEDMLGIGIKFGENQQFEISANYFHYSNLGFYDDNDGIDIWSGTFSVWF